MQNSMEYAERRDKKAAIHALYDKFIEALCKLYK